MSRSARSAIGVLLSVVVLLASAANAETWRFAVIGDTPYSGYEENEFPGMLADIAAHYPEFVVHAGDFKSSRVVCSDEVFLERRARFNASRVPLIYVPGDNEWTDCGQLLAGHYEPQERLQRLRELFFAKALSLGQRQLALEQQPGAYPEQLRWRLGPVLFISLNVPGSNNNFGMGSKPGPEFLARNPQVIAWLEKGFATARREHAAGIVIVMQGNPGFKHYAAGLAHAGYRQLLDALRRETLAFPGQVLLIHGDTHWRRTDHPLLHPGSKVAIANFTRLETFGYPFMGWEKVIIDSEQPQLFRFEVYPHQRH